MKNRFLPLLLISSLFIGGCTIQPSNTGLPIKNTEVTPTGKPTAIITPSVDETSVIKTTIKKAIVAKRGGGANELNISVSKIIGNYSQGGASGAGGGGMWFAAKINNEWKLVWDGNGIILCDDLKNYPDFPSLLIPECYDQKTDKLIKR